MSSTNHDNDHHRDDSHHDSSHHDSSHHDGTGGVGRRVLAFGVGAIVAAGLAGGLAIGLGGGAGTPASATPSTAASPTSTSHATQPEAPSAAVETLQRQLAQLNYYDGPITGTMTPQTVSAITFLQRDAHLPETGRMDAATTAALAHFLATGNNQMGG